MNSEYIAQAIVTLEGESKYHSDDLKDLTQVYAKFDNWLSDEAENGDDLERGGRKSTKTKPKMIFN